MLNSRRIIAGRIIAGCAVSLIAACAKNDQATADSSKMAAAPAMTAAPAPAVTLASFAGKWNVVSKPTEGKDTSSTKYTITADGSTWTIDFPSGLKVTETATLSGDSVMLKTGQYASQRRKGVKTWTEGAVKLQGGMLVGTTTAHYAVKTADSVLHLTTHGTKQP